jgi:hypothetical protein
LIFFFFSYFKKLINHLFTQIFMPISDLAKDYIGENKLARQILAEVLASPENFCYQDQTFTGTGRIERKNGTIFATLGSIHARGRAQALNALEGLTQQGVLEVKGSTLPRDWRHDGHFRPENVNGRRFYFVAGELRASGYRQNETLRQELSELLG